MLQFIIERRSRSNEAHLAPYYVPQLRHLVEAELAKNTAGTCNSVIIVELKIASVRFRLFGLRDPARDVLTVATV